MFSDLLFMAFPLLLAKVSQQIRAVVLNRLNAVPLSMVHLVLVTLNHKTVFLADP